MRIRTFLKYGTLISTSTTILFLHHNNWDLSSIGAVRFGRAAHAAIRVAVDYKLTYQRLDENNQDYYENISKLHRRSALRLRDMCCLNGGVFIKIGQHIGSLEYLLPVEYAETMKLLHDRAPQSPLPDMCRVIEEDLKHTVEDLFIEFDPEPVGAASLAQVYKARLKDGSLVAVKIQHPKVRSRSYVDIETMQFLLNAIAWMFPTFQYRWLGEEWRKNLPLELDFLNEGHNCENASKMFKKLRFLKIPKVYWELSSTRILTMEYCEGGKVDDRQYMIQHGISSNEVSRKLGELYSEMIFVQGYVHCDPHPGNVFVNKSKQGLEIVLLDHGLYQTLTDDFRRNYSKLWLSLINTDLEGIKKYAEALNVGAMYGLLACMLTARSWKAVSSGINKHNFSKEEDLDIKTTASNYIMEISHILNKVPRQMLLLLKTNDVLRGIESSLETRSNSVSFISMSKSCVRGISRDELKQCDSWVGRLIIQTKMRIQLCKISLYELYLLCSSSSLARYFQSTGRTNTLYV